MNRGTDGQPQRVILDVDTGVDDALAIALALRSPTLQVVGITTVGGNVDLEQATANTLLTLDVLGAPPIPVVRGAAEPLARRERPTAAHVHGADGLGGARSRYPASSRQASAGAPRFLLEMIRRHPGVLTLVATAPLTNVAQALQEDPETMRRLRGIAVMGGALRVPGNIGPVSEFNFAADPDAAAMVVRAGLPLRLVPLDVTEQVTLTEEALTPPGQVGPVADFVRDITAFTMQLQREREGVAGIFLHDPLAVGVVADPSLVQDEAVPIDVERRGELTAGMLVADLRRRRRGQPTTRVGTGVDAPRFLELFTRRVLA
jgi:inosine-uridine nucleoside N-ribohydrolase